MNVLASRRSWLLAPVAWALSIAALAAVWAVMEPSALKAAFDGGGYSFFEAMTVPFFALIVPAVWLCCPFSGSPARKVFLCLCVSCLAAMAVAKELDLHVMLLQRAYPDVVGPNGSVCGLVKPNGAPLTGTPFKMRFLTNGAAPLGAKCMVVAYFVLLFGVFAAMLAYYFPRLVRGFFRLHPVAWTMCFFGLSGVMVQMCDRLPAWYRHSQAASGAGMGDSMSALCTALEEGGEMMIAAFALLAILQAHAIYAPDRPGQGLAEL